MKKIVKICLIALLTVSGRTITFAGHVLTIKVIDACTNTPMPDGNWVNFVSGEEGSSSPNYYVCTSTGGEATYRPSEDDVIRCGHIEPANGAVLSSISPRVFCSSCSTANYWCPDSDNTITVYLSLPVT